ncbi:polysaccharide biosynthesis/export family protein [Desulfovibrio inopinatus]|uniref:polysaccharide biosynthesis/export family protein n=1 Tax=Desulfovibrio inopinatus TaxID=102109 RepID=UPI000480320A|nr:polysaccharide biosynthesis/export family protein [Desulfovibrio inopinatus]
MQYHLKRILVLGVFTFFIGIVANPALVCAKTAPNTDFHLGGGDVLEVSVWNDEALNREVLVRPDGYISFPLIGDVVAKGRTIEDVRAEIEKRIREFIPDTTVTVMLLKLTSPQVYVVGKVNSPGMYLMQGPTRVMQALAWAGGPTAYASQSSIRILRSENGAQEVFRFDYDDVKSGDDLEQNILLHPGDTIVVP